MEYFTAAALSQGARIEVAKRSVFADLGLEPVSHLGGGQSQVVLARKLTDRTTKKAVKIFHFNNEYSNVFANLFIREVSILQMVSHPNIMGNITPLVDYNMGVISMDFYPEGSLTQHLGSMNFDLSTRVFLQIACALRYLHGQRIAHRDIKPDNVLLKGDKAVLTDVGLAVCLGPDQTRVQDSSGTPGFTAPEIVRSKETNKRLSYDPFKSDSYSLGMLLWCLLMQRLPYKHCIVQPHPQPRPQPQPYHHPHPRLMQRLDHLHAHPQPCPQPQLYPHPHPRLMQRLHHLHDFPLAQPHQHVILYPHAQQHNQLPHLHPQSLPQADPYRLVDLELPTQGLCPVQRTVAGLLLTPDPKARLSVTAILDCLCVLEWNSDYIRSL